MGDSLLKWLGLDKPPQQRVRHKVWGKQLVDNTRQLKLGAGRARQRTDMEMLDGTEVVRVVGALEAGPVAVDGMWIGAKLMQGQLQRQVVATWLVLQEVGMMNVFGKSGTQDSGDWVEGIGIGGRVGAEAEAAAAEVVAGAEAEAAAIKAAVGAKAVAAAAEGGAGAC